ncbi:hypothetical protein CR513_00036, partial [Mucuna pruriens]
MMEFFDPCHIDMWDVVENGNHIPINKEGAEIPRSSWNEEQKTRYLINSKARNFLIKSTIASHLKKCGDTLALVRDLKISMLVHQYELFKMEDNESIDLMSRRFQAIISNLRSLGKIYDNYDRIRKILRNELNEDEGQQKGKTIALKDQKAPKAFRAEE